MQVAIQGAALLVAIKVAFPAMSSNNFFSAGSIVFYLLLVSLFVSVWLLVRGAKRPVSYHQPKLPEAKVEAVSQNSIPAVVFIVEESWIDYTSEKDFPLKLWVRWANEGVDIRLGKLRWAADKINYKLTIKVSALAKSLCFDSGTGPA